MQAPSGPPDQPAAPLARPRPDIESMAALRRERPSEIEVEGEVLEEPPSTAPPPQVYPGRERPVPPSEPTVPLADLFRRLGLADELFPGMLRPEPEEAAPAEEPEITAEPEPSEEPPTTPPVEPPLAREKEYAPPPTRPSHPLLSGTILERLTPLQQAVVLMEVLGQPRALRGGIR